jgi:mannan endo-1,4-beta-mannosidase
MTISQAPLLTVACTVAFMVSLACNAGAEEPRAMGRIRVEGNRLVLDGREYRAIGVNLPHLASGYNGTWRHCGQIYGTPEKMRAAVLAAIDDAAAHDVAFFRFFAMPTFSGRKAWLYDADPAAYWRQMDEVLGVCRTKGIRVIPVLGVTAWKEYAKTEGPRAVLDPESWVYQEVHRFVTEFVGRYKDDPVILAWALSNEAFLKADVETNRGDPASKGREVFAFDDLLDIYRTWTAVIKSVDPSAIVTSGDSGVRDESAKRRAGVAEARRQNTWPPRIAPGVDTLKQSLANLVESQQSVDLASIHAYVRRPGPGDGVRTADKLGTIAFQAERVKALRAAGKPVLIGEFAQERPYFREDPTGQVALEALDAFEREGASLIAVWVWHFRWQDIDHRPGPGGDRFWNIDDASVHPVLMERMRAFNAQHARGGRGLPATSSADGWRAGEDERDIRDQRSR